MGLEIERKFLVKGEPWRQAPDGVPMRQGYLVTGPPVSVRVRVAGGSARLTLKKAATGTGNLVRHEFEYPVPLEEAEAMLGSLAEGGLVEKTRYRVPCEGFVFEVDVFHGENAGLVVAELELSAPDQPFPRPPWLGEEVTGDPRYLNAALARRPYRRW